MRLGCRVLKVEVCFGKIRMSICLFLLLRQSFVCALEKVSTPTSLTANTLDWTSDAPRSKHLSCDRNICLSGSVPEQAFNGRWNNRNTICASTTLIGQCLHPRELGMQINKAVEIFMVCHLSCIQGLESLCLVLVRSVPIPPTGHCPPIQSADTWQVFPVLHHAGYMFS